VWGTIPEIYWRADQPVAGRFVHHRFVVRLGDREVDAREVARNPRLRERWDLLLADLRDEPPVLVLDASHRDAGGFGTHAPEDYPLGQFLADEYTQIATVRGTRIWKHGSPPHHASETPPPRTSVDISFTCIEMGRPDGTPFGSRRSTGLFQAIQ
jgi:hypothetical protein